MTQPADHQSELEAVAAPINQQCEAWMRELVSAFDERRVEELLVFATGKKVRASVQAVQRIRSASCRACV